MTAIRVLIVDDQPGFRRTVRTDLEDYPHDVVVVGEAASGEQAIDLAGTADVVLMDVQMRGMDGITATRALLAQQPTARVILLTNHDEREFILNAIHAGAVGYVLKECSGDELVNAITAAYQDGTTLSPSVATTVRQALLQRAPRPHVTIELSDTELDILRGVATGQDYSALAVQLSLSEGTIKQYAKKIVTKLGARDRPHAVAIAKDLGII